MSDKVELTGEEFLEMLSKEVTKDYGEVVNKWFEVDNDGNVLAACFEVKDKIGSIRVPVGNEQ